MDPLRDLIGRSPPIVALREQLRALLARETGLRLPPLLITGETGTGKGLLARIIHQASSRAGAQLVELAGPGIPEHLLESELLGYERGAFTDARQSKPGLLQVAHRGTLFLDEVGLLPLSLQAKLLKVLDEGTVRRLGATRSEPVDVWVISATNEDLPALVRLKRFREDLYHRLAAITLWMPPLRDRGDDIDLLADHALQRACAEYSITPVKLLSPEARMALRAHCWPGNVRELNSLIVRAALLCPAATIPAAALGFGPAPGIRLRQPPALVDPVEWDRQRLGQVLAETGWNISRTAAVLRITRNTVRARIARYGLSPPGAVEPLVAKSSVEAPDAVVDAAGRIAADPANGGADVEPGVETESTGSPSEPPKTGARVAVATPLGRPSIAVLPFHVEGEDEARSYFGDGIVEDIIGALASLRELLVISRSSTIRYGGRHVDVRVVGREVGVTYALSGSVRRAGHRLRVSVELAETTRGAVVWASHFDGISDDLFALQDHISARVVGTIAPHVREAELRRALRKRPESMEAYDCFLRGLTQIYRLNAEDFADARTWLEKAIALDPSYAASYALLAIWHSIRVGQGWSPNPAADQAEVMRLAAAALERDSYDAMALALCGHATSILLHEFDKAIALFDRAIAASPSSAVAWTRSSPTYSYLGDAREAIRRAEEGLRLSPLDPHIFYVHTILAFGYYVAGEHDEAVRWGRKANDENPRFTANLRILAASLAAAGHGEAAREAGRRLREIEPGFQVGAFVARYAIRDPERRDRLAHHLRSAGLPG